MKTIEFPQSHCLASVARGDITPPVGIYHRMWGAASHDRSTGVHRPLTATVLWLTDLNEPRSTDANKVIVALDHCLLWTDEMNGFLDRVSEQADIERDSIIVFFSHTHAAGLMGLERKDLPGGDLIPPYLNQLADTTATLIRAARGKQEAATISYRYGRCDLATNRDCLDAERHQYVCGYNPDGIADDTLLVGRVTSQDSRVVATVVNYACHPTTLAWQNTLISPDYVGAMREVVETSSGAPCVFIQGASGDVGPRDGFVGDVEVADRNGRQLGYAVLAALESLPAPLTAYEYAGPVVSGATLGTWQYLPISDRRRQHLATWQSSHRVVPLKYRTDFLNQETLEQERSTWLAEEESARTAGDAARQRDARAMVERATRRLIRVKDLPSGDAFPFPIKVWRIGDGVWLALDGEHYNLLQRALRERFPGVPIVVGTLANGSMAWYLPDSESFGKGLYQEDASILDKGCLEELLEAVTEEITRLL